MKSPQSLARKVRDFLETLDIDEPDDILRYTVSRPNQTILSKRRLRLSPG